MGSSGLTLGPTALLVAVLAYVLKRWWDSADTITIERKRAYSTYFDACYHLTLRTFEEGAGKVEHGRVEAYDTLQRATPDFYLHASPDTLDISDVFFRRAMYFVGDEAPQRGSEDFMKAAEKLQESLNVLREKMKSELFTSSPRFHFERWQRRTRWKSFLEENRK